MKSDLQKRVIFGALALLIFLPLLWRGGVPFQIFVGILSILATAELIRMHRLSPSSIEGILAMFATFVLVIPLSDYMPFLPADGAYTAYALVIFLLMGSIVWHIGSYDYSQVVFPIASSFYVGTGFHHLVAARMDSLSTVLFALLIVWATDSGAYLIGRKIGRRKLMPKVSPNKTLEGSLGGVLSAVFVAAIYLLFDKNLTKDYSYVTMLGLVAIFSVCAQFGDLVESAIKRHFGVKDSGKLIPGHGGVLDRFDSLIFVFPVMHFFGLF